MESDSSSTAALGFLVEFAQLSERRESELGLPAPNCPTAAELWRVVEIVKELHSGDTMGAQQANAYMQELAGISDKWVDPENDPIGVRLHPVLEGTIEGLRGSLEAAFPESAETLHTWGRLRPLQQALQRTVYLRSSNPSWLNRVWTRLSARGSKSESQKV